VAPRPSAGDPPVPQPIAAYTPRRRPGPIRPRSRSPLFGDWRRSQPYGATAELFLLPAARRPTAHSRSSTERIRLSAGHCHGQAWPPLRAQGGKPSPRLAADAGCVGFAAFACLSPGACRPRPFVIEPSPGQADGEPSWSHYRWSRATEVEAAFAAPATRRWPGRCPPASAVGGSRTVRGPANRRGAVFWGRHQVRRTPPCLHGPDKAFQKFTVPSPNRGQPFPRLTRKRSAAGRGVWAGIAGRVLRSIRGFVSGILWDRRRKGSAQRFEMFFFFFCQPFRGQPISLHRRICLVHGQMTFSFSGSSF